MVNTTLKIVQIISQALQNGWVQSSTHSQALHSTTECLLSCLCRFIQGEVSDGWKNSDSVRMWRRENKRGRVRTT